jgi:hypothetical protein
MAEMIGWPLKGFQEAFSEVFGQGMAKADFSAPLVFLPKAIKHNPPQSPNVVISWRTVWSELPECALKLEIWQVLKGFTDEMSEAFREAFAKACPKPIANQEQEQEQKQEKDSCAATSAAPRPAPSDRQQKPKDETTDPRYQQIVDVIRKCWPQAVPFAFDAADGRALKAMLQRRPVRQGWTAEQLALCVGFRFLSEGITVAESVKAWIGAVTDYAGGPRDRYGKEIARSAQDVAFWKHQARLLVGLEQPKASTPQDVLPLEPQPELGRVEDARAAWAELAQTLEKAVNPHSFGTWIKPLRAAGIDGAGVLYVRVPTPEFKHVAQKYGDLLGEAVSGLQGINGIEFVCLEQAQ